MKRFPKWRQATAIVLIVFGCMVATVSVGVIWLNRVVLDTDKYVETVAPLSQDPAVKDALAARITDALFTGINAEQLAQEALPDKVDFLAAPIVGATEGFVQEQVREELDSARFTSLWEDANRKGHQTARKLLLGEGDIIRAQSGQVTIDLEVLIEEVKARLSARGIDFFQNVSLPAEYAQFTIFESQRLADVQNLISLLNGLALWLPVITLALWGAAIVLARRRMIAVMWIGFGFSIGMVILLVGLSYGQSRYVATIAAAETVDAAAATSVIDAFTDSLKTAVQQMFALGLLAGAVGLSLSPYSSAVRARVWLWNLYRAGVARGAKIDLGPVGTWIASQKALLRAAGIVLALVILVAMDEPTVSWALLIAAILAVYIAALEYIGRKAA